MLSDGEKLAKLKKIGIAIGVGGIALGAVYVLGRYHGVRGAMDMVRDDIIKIGEVPKQLLELDTAGESWIVWRSLEELL